MRKATIPSDAMIREKGIQKAISLTVRRLPMSPNSLRGRHWSVKHEDKKDWDTQIMVAAGRQRPGVAANERKAVTIALFIPYRLMDPDNLHGSIKPILDALKINRLIYDDSGEWLEYTVSQTKVAIMKEARTEICVKGLP